ncbi:MoaD/ThiS family protein [bacterium]|nr:MAG: MoaD/ThiS family protein [bacterium]
MPSAPHRLGRRAPELRRRPRRGRGGGHDELQDGRRDGGADRRRRGLPDPLRHGQGRGPGHGRGAPVARREVRRALRDLPPAPAAPVTVKVLLFASARRWAGAGELTLEPKAGARASDVFADPRLAALVPHRAALRLAVNEEFVADGHPLKDGDVVAVLPPVSGG